MRPWDGTARRTDGPVRHAHDLQSRVHRGRRFRCFACRRGYGADDLEPDQHLAPRLLAVATALHRVPVVILIPELK